ncbi:MAG TPA: hypothetical protein VFJ64_01300 [Solirubrobacterales bacterium]|nr:hypothetical protein [Solirubrobacterales bacterium]
MLADLVIDTNVFVHADNPAEKRYTAASALLNALVDGETEIGVDDGFDLDPSANKSLIGHEYLEKLTPLSAGFRVLAHLAQSGRTKFVSKKFDPATRKQINQIVRNKRDRTFLLVSTEMDDRVFCSHDFKDFQKRKRRDIKAKLGVSILEADEVLNAMSES